MGKRGCWIPYAALAVVSFGLFADVLFFPGDKVASAPFGDINNYYYASRAFSTAQMRAGDLPLWNPYLFSGSPHLPNIQTALFYPPNLIYLVLPLSKAFNFDLALHVFLFGAFTCAWALNRGLRKAAAFTAGVLAMLSGALIMHVFAGHVPMVASFAWTPLVLLALDKIISTRFLGWAVVGALAVDMQILAGSPHVVFMTFVAAAPYVLLKIRQWVSSPRSIAGLAMVGLLPILLSAIQLWPTLAFIPQCTPHGDGSLSYATSHSFPPENFLMLILPNFWGNAGTIPYGGRWFAWEVFAFIGVTGLFLSFTSIFATSFRKNLPLYAALVTLFLIALGRYTPVYGFFYAWLPGFDKFRVPARYLVVASPFLAVLAAEALQSFIDRPKRRHALAPLLAAALLLAAAVYIHATSVDAGPNSPGARLVRQISMRPKPSRAWLEIATPNLRRELFRSSTILLVMGLLMGFAKKKPFLAYALVALCTIEMILFAFPIRSGFDPHQTQPPGLRNSLARAGGSRVLDSPGALNRVFFAGGLDAWGSDPLIQLRYAEFMAHAAKIAAPLHKAGEPRFLSGAALAQTIRLIRVAYLIDDKDNLVPLPWLPLPQFSLISGYRVEETPKGVFEALDDSSFNSRFNVVLEAPPVPVPDPAAKPGTIQVIQQTSDQFVLDIDTPSPAILLNTDAYASGWRAKPLEKSQQQQYQVMPANYATRAIPLAAGHHKILLEYVPPLFSLGKWVSISTTLLLLLAALSKLLPRRPGSRVSSQ